MTLWIANCVLAGLIWFTSHACWPLYCVHDGAVLPLASQRMLTSQLLMIVSLCHLTHSALCLHRALPKASQWIRLQQLAELVVLARKMTLWSSVVGLAFVPALSSSILSWIITSLGSYLALRTMIFVTVCCRLCSEFSNVMYLSFLANPLLSFFNVRTVI